MKDEMLKVPKSNLPSTKRRKMQAVRIHDGDLVAWLSGGAHYFQQQWSAKKVEKQMRCYL